jgi:hypothetical protein
MWRGRLGGADGEGPGGHMKQAFFGSGKIGNGLVVAK